MLCAFLRVLLLLYSVYLSAAGRRQPWIYWPGLMARLLLWLMVVLRFARAGRWNAASCYSGSAADAR